MLCSRIDEENAAAVAAAKDAFVEWRDTPVQRKQRYVHVQQMIRDRPKRSRSHHAEQGKTLDARGCISRPRSGRNGLQCNERNHGRIPQNLASGLDSVSFREPLGVVAGICPFNFPAMIPLWMFPLATTGNTFVLAKRA